MKHLKQQPTQEQEIDWSKPMWVIDKVQSRIVLTTGSHNEDRFIGTCLPDEDFPFGEYSDRWLKLCFKPLTGTIMFPISNDND